MIRRLLCLFFTPRQDLWKCCRRSGLLPRNTASGSNGSRVPRVMDLLKQGKMDDVIVVVGGIIPNQDIEGLKKIGVAAIFQPGTAMDDIVQFIRTHVKGPGVPAAS